MSLRSRGNCAVVSSPPAIWGVKTPPRTRGGGPKTWPARPGGGVTTDTWMKVTYAALSSKQTRRAEQHIEEYSVLVGVL